LSSGVTPLHDNARPHAAARTQAMLQDVRFQVLTVASMTFRVVFWDILPCKMIVPDDGGSTYLGNVGRQSFYTAVYPRRQL
jgi:hypothetical protein